MKIWICEDDNTLWDDQKEAILERFPKAKIKHFENAGYAARSTGHPDFIIIDIGGAMGLGCDVVSIARYNIEGLHEKHPGTIFILTSAISIYAEDAYNELTRDIQIVSEWVDGYGMEKICDVIDKY